MAAGGAQGRLGGAGSTSTTPTQQLAKELQRCNRSLGACIREAALGTVAGLPLQRLSPATRGPAHDLIHSARRTAGHSTPSAPAPRRCGTRAAAPRRPAAATPARCWWRPGPVQRCRRESQVEVQVLSSSASGLCLHPTRIMPTCIPLACNFVCPKQARVAPCAASRIARYAVKAAEWPCSSQLRLPGSPASPPE